MAPGRIGQRVGVAAGVVVLLLVAGACSRPPQSALTVVALGDSVSVADSPDFDAGSFGPGSWAAHADGPPVELRGGWALDGATTGYLVDHARALAADVLVIMAGTNDVLQEVPGSTTEHNLEVLAARSDVDVVVLCSIVPSTRARTENVAFNDRLTALAAHEGWDFVDCAAPVRTPDGGWVAGTTTDGVHPTTRGAELIGDAVREHLLDLRSSGRVPG